MKKIVGMSYQYLHTAIIVRDLKKKTLSLDSEAQVVCSTVATKEMSFASTGRRIR